MWLHFVFPRPKQHRAPFFSVENSRHHCPAIRDFGSSSGVLRSQSLQLTLHLMAVIRPVVVTLVQNQPYFKAWIRSGDPDASRFTSKCRSSNFSCSSLSNTAQTSSLSSNKFRCRLLPRANPSAFANSIALCAIVIGTPTPRRLSIDTSAPVQTSFIAEKYAGSVFRPSQNRMKRTLGSRLGPRRLILPVLRFPIPARLEQRRNRIVTWHCPVPSLQVS